MECHPSCALITKISLHALNEQLFPFLLPAVRMYAHVAGLVALLLFFFKSEFSFVLPLFLCYRLWLLILLPCCQCPLGLSFLGLSSLDMNLLRLRFLSLCQQTLGNLVLFWPFSVLFCQGFFITMQTTIGVSTSSLICFAHAYFMQSALQDFP